MTIQEAMKIAFDILPKEVLAQHVTDKENSEELYALLTAMICKEANGESFKLRVSDASHT